MASKSGTSRGGAGAGRSGRPGSAGGGGAGSAAESAIDIATAERNARAAVAAGPIKRTIGDLEKKGGPYIPGAQSDGGTVVSAVYQQTSGARRGQYVGVVGNVKGAQFRVTFARPLNLPEGTLIQGLKSDGPQGNFGRREAYEKAKRK